MKIKYQERMEDQLKQFAVAHEAGRTIAATEHWSNYIEAKRLYTQLCEENQLDGE